jgi:DNA anti-recombination protein RmuC
MTQEDLNQIRAIMREEIASSNETLSAALRTEFAVGLERLRTEFHDHLTAVLVALRQEFTERLGAATVSFDTDFSELRKELGQRIDALGRRMDALEHRMDRIGETTATIATELATLTRWANRLDRENLETLNTQAAQQRAIERSCETAPPAEPATELTHSRPDFARLSRDAGNLRRSCASPCAAAPGSG